MKKTKRNSSQGRLPINAEHEELIDTYIKYQIKYRSISQGSVQSYLLRIYNYANFLEKRNLSMLTATSRDIKKYALYHARDKRQQTIEAFLGQVRRFYEWASSSNIGLLKKNPYPTDIQYVKLDDFTPFIPTASEIFKVREIVKCLEEAVILEMLICTGMRIGELCQVRWIDIDWDVAANDASIGRPSPFLCAKIDLDSSRFKVKRTRRTVFISKIAGKALRAFARELSIDLDSTMPITSLAQRQITDVFFTRYDYLFKNRVHKHIPKREDERSRETRYYKDDIVDDLEIKDGDNETVRLFKKRLKLSKGRLDRAKVNIPKIANEFVSTQEQAIEKFRPNTLRRFNACAMYYRDWYGGRCNRDTVMALLSHNSFSTTQRYLDIQSNAVRNDKEWVRLWLGSGREYLKLKYQG